MLLQNLTQATSCRTKFTKSRIPPQVTLCDGSNVLASFYSIQFIERNDIAFSSCRYLRNGQKNMTSMVVIQNTHINCI